MKLSITNILHTWIIRILSTAFQVRKATQKRFEPGIEPNTNMLLYKVLSYTTYNQEGPVLQASEIQGDTPAVGDTLIGTA